MLKNDKWIIEQAEKGMITPFEREQVRMVGSFSDARRVISYGTSSNGYDMRCGRDFKVFTDIHTTIIDPKNLDERSFQDFKDVDSCIIPPNSYALTSSLEYFKMPRDVLAICVGKSTYARAGVIVNLTPLEPGWEGNLTIEISNSTRLPVKIYAEEGIGQLLFLGSSEPCYTSYADRSGKYQGQTGITISRM